jgi:hypothetical protein
MTFIAGGATTSVDLSAGYSSNVTFGVSNGILAGDTFKGGTGTANLLTLNSSTYADTDFTNVTNVQALSLAGGSVVLDTKAQASKIATLSSGNSGVSITQGSGFTNPLTLIGGTGSDTFELATKTQLTADSIIGGSGAPNQLILDQAISYTAADFSRISGIQIISLTGVSTFTGGAAVDSTGISTILGGAGADSINATGMSNNILIQGQNNFADTFTGGLGNDTFQGFTTGLAASNTASDTFTGGTGADLFIMAGSGDTKNAYGNGQAGNPMATINSFAAGGGADKLQLHEFGGANAGSAGYQTVSGGAGIIDIYTYQDTLPGEHVAHLTGVTGTFSWTNNATFV